MEVINIATNETVNLTCNIDEQDTSYDVIGNYCGFDDYIVENEFGESYYQMTSEEIKYWDEVFIFLEDIHLFKKTIYKKNKDLYENLHDDELSSVDKFSDLQDRVDFVWNMYEKVYCQICSSDEI